MRKAAQTRLSDDPRQGRHQAGSDLTLALVPLATLATTVWWLFGLPVGYLVQVSLVYLCLVVVVIRYLPDEQSTKGLGAANRVTLGRATLIVPLSALALQPLAITDEMAWFIVGVATIALVLDGVDGWMARRSDTASAFGARFDMELDSFLMLVLSMLVWRSGKVGAWAILIGLPRYLFVAASWVWPRLRGELPPRLRRKAVCVAQGVLLLVCLGPIISPTRATLAGGTALAVLAYSFAVDIIWLVRHGPDRQHA